MPTGQQFQEAIQNPHLSLADAELQIGKPLLNELGLPKPIAGNFAAVFTLVCDGGRRYAIKCFFNDYADLHERYDAIHRHFQLTEYPWEVVFEYVPRGIRIGSTWHPIVKMEWIDAVRLDRYVEEHLGRPNVILNVARSFADLVKTLNVSSVAHGDLQHGNILVTQRGELRLVDYDGMYVPTLAGRASHEFGHPNYQHPSRTDQNFGPYLDNFSAWVIYISLLALAVDPTIWTRVGGGDDALVFKRQDFDGGIFSPGFGAIEAAGNEQLRELAAKLRGMLSSDITRIPALAPIDLEVSEPFSLSADPSAASTPVARDVRPSRLPSWLSAGHSTHASAGSTAESSGGLEWMISQLGQPPVVAANFRVAFPRTILLVVAAVIGTVTTLGATQVISTPYAIVPIVPALILALAGCWMSYRRVPEVRAKQRTLRELAVRRHGFAEAAAVVEQSSAERASNDEDERSKAAEIQRKQAHVLRDEQQSLQHAEQRMQSRLFELAKGRAGLTSVEQAERARALIQLQQDFVQGELARHFISSASIRGVGAALRSNLAAAGIHTAADFRGVSISGGGYYGNPIAYVVLWSGRNVHVSGIGPAKGRELANWRTAIENRVRARAPQSLPQAQSRQIQHKFSAKLSQIGSEEQVARRTGQEEADRVRSDSQQSQARLRADLQNIRVFAAQRRAQLDQHLAQAKTKLRSEQWALARKSREADAYREITFRRFVGASVGF